MIAQIVHINVQNSTSITRIGILSTNVDEKSIKYDGNYYSITNGNIDLNTITEILK